MARDRLGLAMESELLSGAVQNVVGGRREVRAEVDAGCKNLV